MATMSTSAAFCRLPVLLPARWATRPPAFTCALSRPPAQPVPPATSRASALDTAFSAWAAENSVEMPSLSLSSFPTVLTDSAVTATTGLQRGMVAITPLTKGAEMLAVRSCTTLQVNSLDVTRSPLPDQIALPTWRLLPWYARLAVLLLHRRLNPADPLQPWLARLPTSFDTPLHWTDAQLRELQNAGMERAVRKQSKMYRSLFDGLNGNPENTIARSITYDDFVWAVECIRSRAFSGPLEVAPFKQRLSLFLFILTNTLAWPVLNLLSWEKSLNGGLTALFALTTYDFILPKILRIVQGVQLKRYAMTPGIDFINHSSAVTGQAEVSFEYFSDRFVVHAGEDYVKGDQVFISYGAQSNDSLLQFYGFVEDNNPADNYTFSADVEKLLGVQEGKLVLTNAGFHENTIQAVTKKLKRNKDSARQTLQELCSAELGGLPTTLEEDMDMLEKGHLDNDARLKLAVRYRIEKKRLLKRGVQ